MLLLAAHARQGQTVVLKPFLLAVEGLVRFLVDSQQLRGEERGGLAEIDQEILR